MKWNIIADSSCDLHNFSIPENEIYYSTVPFGFNIGTKTLIDDAELDTQVLLNEIVLTSEKVGTACPAPYDWYNAMGKDGNCILLTISGALSGSANSAVVAKNMILRENPDRKIAIIDTKSTGPEIVLLVYKLCDLIKSNLLFDDVIKQANEILSESRITFALSSFDNLIKAGRMPKMVGRIAKMLGIWGVGIASEQGTIVVKRKVCGKLGAIRAIIEDIETRVIYPLSVVISHCHNLEFAQRLKDKIKETWEKVVVQIIPTRGLCSYYAEQGGVIVGFWGKHIFDSNGKMLKNAVDNIAQFS